uniref:Uncharacterized protein n=1 Tax=Arundo donax TaxID=35708 RepID=A0A0A9EWN9_ARUDO
MPSFAKVKHNIKKASYQAITFSAIQGIPILHDLFTR